MGERTFNLTRDPWIKVLDQTTGQEKTVSLIDLFEHAQDYQRLAGEMQSQDFAIMRLLLAILTTVYSRFDATGEAYEWLELDKQSLQPVAPVDEDEYSEKDIRKDLQATWKALSQAGHFSTMVTQYLQRYADRFDLFGDQPFYQATTTDYDALVPANKSVAKGKGQVSVKQLNRRISESNNSPALFAPKVRETKNQVPLDELVRWLITYQNFTGVTDKTKVVAAEKFSNSPGWIYRLNPVFAVGDSLFETLMLNLILGSKQSHYARQKPVWEYDGVQAYVAERQKQLIPDNLAALYTTWSRLLHIEWDDQEQPSIFSAGIPIFPYENAFVEPMTTWRRDKKTLEYRPAVKGLRSLGIAMWRNFGQYVKVNQSDDVHEPGLVTWLHELKQNKLIATTQRLNLASVALLSDGNATSQSPAAEVVDDMRISADVLFDADPDTAAYWPTRIEDVIPVTQSIGSDYYHFASDIGKIRRLG